MKSLRLLTWLDVRRTISRKTNYGSKLPDGVVRIRCFSDALEIGLRSEDNKENAANSLKEWFGDWYQKDLSVIQLDLGDATLPVEFLPGEERGTTDISVRPFWEEIAYIGSDLETEIVTSIVQLPEPYTEKPNLIAFYSFKGGVGRTLNLVAHLFALLDRSQEIDKSISILVIDADLEAPGLTYWNRLEKQQPAVSFIDFLESYHYPPIEREETLSLFAREVQKSARHEGKSTVYFLPACIADEQLLDTPVLPEQLVKSPDGAWECGNAIHSLGKAVGADYVLIDLRAGLSEISSPIIFDPRIQRFIVTTITLASVAGTSFVLQQIGRVAPPEAKVGDQSYHDPSLVITMLLPDKEGKPPREFTDAYEQFEAAYVQTEEDDLSSTRLKKEETYFASELLAVNSWEEARIKLNSTSVMKIARDWAESQLPITTTQQSSSKIEEEPKRLEEVHRLRDLCQQYECAEEGKGEDLLVTEALKNLAANFQDELPCVVCIGAKGAGKTFNYIHLSRFKYWERFLRRVDQIGLESDKTAYIFPLLQSGTLKDNARNVINEARSEVRTALGNGVTEFIPSECVDRIKRAISEGKWSEPEWTQFWINEIARAIGINIDQQPSLASINRKLKDRSLRIIFLFDGLEDIFFKIASSSQEKTALKSLIDDLPNKLSEIRQSNLGVIIFLRRDFLRYAKEQNLKQFENLYRSYDLSWNHDSFLRLVFWICSQAKVIDAEQVSIDSLSKENFIDRLEKLWGKILGTDKSKEAYTASWVFAALTDFNGRLQARDIVRFLYHAAKITADRTKELQFEKWSTNRLLPPQAIRRALEPCSKKKVDEAKEEYPAFKTWVDETLPNYPPAERRIPFAGEQFGIDPQIARTLEEMGVIYEDKEKEDTERFYMPEIFREGLGFSGTGARPRVLALKRKVLGRGIV